ncbi:MAG: phosphoglycerate kinase [Epulopiscium sp. Nuni2H_MBin003]|nr:MAG: phosphoglycerate kinase [Epulopiscium sp. Nuni2H_MBin003]
MYKLMKKFKPIVSLLLVLLICVSPIYANDYPNKDITIIVPFNAGGGIDISSRTLVMELQKLFPDISFVVQNITGASGTIGAEELFNAKPDGYTFMAAGNGFNVSSVMGVFNRSVEDYEMVAQYTTSQLGLYVRADSPYQTYEDLIEAARANPYGINMGTLSATMNHYAILAIEHANDVNFKHIVVGGDQTPQPELLSGRVDAYVVAVSQNTSYIDSGDFRCLGVFSTDRVASLPDVPTFFELGIEDDFQLTFGFWAPPGTPQDVLDTISDAIKIVCEDPTFQNTMHGMGYLSGHIGSEEYAEVMANSLHTVQSLADVLDTSQEIDPYVGAFGLPNFILGALVLMFIFKGFTIVFVKKEKLKVTIFEPFKGRPAVFFISLIVYALVFDTLGFIISSTIFLTGNIIYLKSSTKQLEKKDYVQALLIAAVFSVVVFIFFTQGAKIILCSHLGKPKGEAKPELSLAPVAASLSKHLGIDVKFANDDTVTGAETKAMADSLADGDVMLLQNTRYRV